MTTSKLIENPIPKRKLGSTGEQVSILSIGGHAIGKPPNKKDGIKILTLFFIDRVDNYAARDGIIRLLFDRAFDDIKQRYGSAKIAHGQTLKRRKS